MSSRRRKEAYFNALYSTVVVNKAYSYRKVLKLLHEREFEYEIYMDKNRYADGESYRDRLGYSDVKDGCSVLEMMVALAVRIEEDIMDDPRYGNRIPQWFWHMMKNLGLSQFNDEEYDEEACNDIIDTFLDREYDYDGKGGLFRCRKAKADLRDYQIWIQASWYLDELV